ncbi:hypothetical protein T492DRAFT_1105951 [Pavlovales sp. CCMP2436]|nr:hypothetical protein T492DRAFT_1105951 [Pavlovales sp. CCMP2436]
MQPHDALRVRQAAPHELAARHLMHTPRHGVRYTGQDRSISALLGAAELPREQTAPRALWHFPLIASKQSSSSSELLMHEFAVACGVATFWRGTWYMMDALCPADPLLSGISCLSFGFVSFAIAQSVVGPLFVQAVPSGALAPVVRIATLYWLGVSCVATWRGVWSLIDVVSENVAGTTVAEHLLHSGIASHLGAVALLLSLGRLTAILAPPAKTGLLNDNKIWDGSPPRELRSWLDWNLWHLRRQQEETFDSVLAHAQAVSNSDARTPGAKPAPRLRIRRVYSSDES